MIRSSPTTPSLLQGKNGGVGSSMIQEPPHCATRTMKQFQIELAKQLVGNFCSRRKRERQADEGLQLACHTEWHFQDFLPLNETGKR